MVFDPKQEEVSCGDPLLESADHTALVAFNSFRQSRRKKSFKNVNHNNCMELPVQRQPASEY